MLELGEREKRILEAVVLDYIRTAEPVGSRTLSRRHNLDVSPATIRNAMADLEDMGLLNQPHTSAGRLPTDAGLRYYVDTILEVKSLTGADRQAITREFEGAGNEIEQLVKRVSRVLSNVSKQIGIVMAPRFSQIVLNRIQFVRLGDNTVLVILVGQNGMLQNRIIETEEDLQQEDLDRFNRYLNEILGGLTIAEIKARIVEEMREEKNRFDRMLSRALELSSRVFDNEEAEDELYVNGQVNLLDYPEFAAVDAMKGLFSAFEDKSVLVRLLDKTLLANGVRIFIGSENETAEMQGCTLIASRYSKGSRPLGTLGVIGPTRLNYSKIIPVVDYTARMVGRILETSP